MTTPESNNKPERSRSFGSGHTTMDVTIWENQADTPAKTFVCGFCADKVSSSRGWRGATTVDTSQTFMVHGFQSGGPVPTRVQERKPVTIQICPACGGPTYFDSASKQLPGQLIGDDLILPLEIGKLYNECRAAYAAAAPTCTTMGLRTLLAHVAVDKGAKDNLNFAAYVQWLADNHFVPPGSKTWIDEIRKIGNEAVHDLRIVPAEDAEQLIRFTEQILRFVYDYPSRVVSKQ